MTTMEGTATREFAVARYSGVAVWASVAPPRSQVRALQQNERVELVADEGDGWLRVRLSDGAEGLVQRSALRAYDPLQAPSTPVSQPLARLDSGRAASRPFPGAPRVALGLTIFAWICAVGGQLAAFGAAADYDCSNTFFSDCSDEGATRVVLYLTFAIPSFITALFAWGIAYTIRLLGHLEDRLDSALTAPVQSARAVAAGDVPKVTERCEVCGNVFSTGMLSVIDGKRTCRQCAAAARL